MTRFSITVLTVLLFIAAAGCGGLKSTAPAPGAPAAVEPTPEILIPAAEYVMGTEGDGASSPPHPVKLNAFHIDRHEVTNVQYQAYCKETGHNLPEFWGMDRYRSGPEWPDHPVVGVSWWDARSYAEWAGKRLPTEAEFEYAARGGACDRKFYWGDEPDPIHANFAVSTHQAPVPVESYSPNGFGLHDMAGNVSEWVSDYYDGSYYAVSPVDNPRGPEKGRFRVIRGGGWHTGPGCMTQHFRNALPSNWVDFAVGFRCARDADDED